MCVDSQTRKRQTRANEGRHTQGKDFSRAIYSFIPLAGLAAFSDLRAKTALIIHLTSSLSTLLILKWLGVFHLYTELYSLNSGSVIYYYLAQLGYFS